LRNAGGGHGGLIVKNATKMVTVGNTSACNGQKGATGIDQVDAGQVVLTAISWARSVF
jgi:hypothetical protein